MLATQIQIAYVNLPKTENGPGSIKDSSGVYWTLWKDQLPNFLGREGQVVTINYETKTYRGKPQHTIVGLAGTAVGMPPVPPRQAPIPSGNYAPTAPTVTIPQEFTNPTEKDENIAVLALVKEWMGKIPVGDLAGVTHALRTCRAAWREFKKTHAAAPVPPPAPGPVYKTAGVPKASFSEELNDEIPSFDEPGRSIDETF